MGRRGDAVAVFTDQLGASARLGRGGAGLVPVNIVTARSGAKSSAQFAQEPEQAQSVNEKDGPNESTGARVCTAMPTRCSSGPQSTLCPISTEDSQPAVHSAPNRTLLTFCLPLAGSALSGVGSPAFHG